jgi:hypothetical protein
MPERSLWLLTGLTIVTGGCASNRGLDIYFIDMVGGAATLIVTPERETILVDSGRALERDASRIEHVLREVVGRPRIDHMVTTHWHLDHYGGIGLLDGRIAFGQFHDRGIPEQSLDDPENFPKLIAAYKKASGGVSNTLVAGDAIPLRQGSHPPLTLRCLMAGGKMSPSAPEHAEPNPFCDQHVAQPPDTGDDGMSLVLLLSYGDFDFYNAGDLTWNFERDLVCPVNRVGQVELFQTAYHGAAKSNNPVLVHALRPRVAVMCNGPRKGGAKETVATLRAGKGLADIWQLHRNTRSSEAEQPPADRTANWRNPEGGAYIHVHVEPSGREFTTRISTDGPALCYPSWND